MRGVRSRKEKLMKYCVFILVAILSFICNLYAFDCDENAVITYRISNGFEEGIFIKQDQILNAPTWTAGTSEPALSISQAISRVQQSTKHQYEKIEIDSIALNKYLCGKPAGNWYYIIDYTPINNNRLLFKERSSVAVLFDGTVIGRSRK
jgi:hypothetical protein